MQTSQILIMIVWALFITFLLGQNRVMRTFHLVDERTLIGSEEEYMKLNALIEYGEASVYTHSDGNSSLVLTYRNGKSEKTVLNSKYGKKLKPIVNEMYDLSVKLGYIKE